MDLLEAELQAQFDQIDKYCCGTDSDHFYSTVEPQKNRRGVGSKPKHAELTKKQAELYKKLGKRRKMEILAPLDSEVSSMKKQAKSTNRTKEKTKEKKDSEKKKATVGKKKTSKSDKTKFGFSSRARQKRFK
ncbi:hypothetical protein ADUPG1_007282 [Aduncisulcus paluster]|uniref:Uncharacterized protein n=1 Tax=Aduncisulcus paluster TaxID=2918883 RepID=A0ABQ5KPH7_9EUKA|nr:hypothetical protein ADUPG1_007282 [Aduncisulcus paluster]|eukprot:gnl/Carplike_NY0171/2349_a3166_492.p1 GENE.gnl/Carplike_NY0171/2349_a3166_492~~gnl/Carplike_NY0171/2349_a3166_492.p1  ORF type:complete len:132 (-),score=38.26 gnl/Carplike_NY0171/2349_a3166_492:450-845(-)